MAQARAEAGRENRIDPVLLPVMANRMDAVCREMTNTMLLAARSSVIGMARDFSCAVITSDNQVLAVAEGFPIHVWGTNIQTKSMQDLHPDYAEGDAYLHNDPYLGNTYPADHTIIVPVFHEGEHFFSVAVKAHQADVGNSLPTHVHGASRGRLSGRRADLPLRAVQRDFRDIDDIIRMCERRIRVPEQWYGDYLAAVGAARIGERSLKTFIAKYGAHAVRHFTEEWFDYSERRCIEAIRTLPKGKLKGAQAHDPVEPWVPEGIPINVTIDIDPDAAKVTVDLRDNIDCIDAGLNLTETTSTMAAVQGVLTCLGVDLPPNSGTMRRIEVLLRENCAVGIPRFPHSCSVATTNLTDVIVNVTQSAFAELGEGQGFAHGNYCNSAAAGVASGTGSRLGGNAKIERDGSEHPYPAVMVCDLEGGERLRALDQGGGYGSPMKRETHRVLNDVAERFISAETARDVYGVAIAGNVDDDTLAVDEAAAAWLDAVWLASRSSGTTPTASSSAPWRGGLRRTVQRQNVCAPPSDRASSTSLHEKAESSKRCAARRWWVRTPFHPVLSRRVGRSICDPLPSGFQHHQQRHEGRAAGVSVGLDGRTDRRPPVHFLPHHRRNPPRHSGEACRPQARSARGLVRGPGRPVGSLRGARAAV